MINRRSAGFGFLWGEQRLQPLPLRIGQISSVHTYQYNDLYRVCKHALAQVPTIEIDRGLQPLTLRHQARMLAPL